MFKIGDIVQHNFNPQRKIRVDGFFNEHRFYGEVIDWPKPHRIGSVKVRGVAYYKVISSASNGHPLTKIFK